MSDTTTATVPGVIGHIDPHRLITETNVRTQTVLSAVFVDSVRTAGVLTPIFA